MDKHHHHGDRQGRREQHLDQDKQHETGRAHGEKRDGDRGRRAERHGVQRRQRFLAHGDLRLIILDLLSRSASHGYELIKAIESLTLGHYSPSPGVIYPTLDFLQEQEHIRVSDELNGRKILEISDSGRQFLADNAEPLHKILERIKARAVGAELRKNPEMKRAIDNIKSVLDLKMNHHKIDDDTLKKIIGIIDNAAQEIAQLP
ncbi:PadR family transcriptional regulator [Affinibrenneria salicis]|uniref:PadR family transcriptional regulator n=1 Tax=Affinibrenneria salicis TaxID=2590031 RepID=A0A5J5FTX5_9GAMM|nr:PadR family transcriptional regulator [Affinibrenneria salicis]KAA8996664.1 PadR family transcriptional regulator [Affinibrenneria salicis]